MEQHEQQQSDQFAEQRGGVNEPSPLADVPSAEQPVGEATVEHGPEASLEQDLDALVAKAQERDEYLQLAQRTQADFENYRRRIARELSTAQDRGIVRLVKELLPTFDNFELALKHVDEADTQLVEGFKLVYTELTGALERVSVESFSPAGEKFDPEHHEAMVQRPEEGTESGTVIEVYQRGYRLKETTIRPARVVVAE